MCADPIFEKLVGLFAPTIALITHKCGSGFGFSILVFALNFGLCQLLFSALLLQKYMDLVRLPD